MHDSFIEDTNRKLLELLPYPELIIRLDRYKEFQKNEANSEAGWEYLDLPSILYILNLSEFQVFKRKSLESEDLHADVKKFVRRELPKINYYYNGGIYVYLKNREIDETPLSSELKASSSFGLQFKNDPLSGEEYLLLTKTIRRTDSPMELHPDKDIRTEIFKEWQSFFISNRNDKKRIVSATKRLLLFILKEKLGLSQTQIEDWFEEYGFGRYPNHQYLSREISLYKSLFKTSS